jgi:hypothetical protein
MSEDRSQFEETPDIWIRPFSDIEILTDQNQKLLFKYWRNAHSGEDLPAPEHIDALAFPTTALPFLVLEEFERDTGRFRTRLTGTAYRDSVGYEGADRRTDETPGAERAAERLNWIVQGRQPYWYRGPLTFSHRPWTPFSVLSLPFGRAGEPVSRVLCVFDFQPG